MTDIKKPDSTAFDGLAASLSFEIGSRSSSESLTFESRLTRYSEAKQSTKPIVSYIKQEFNLNSRMNQRHVKLYDKIRTCGSYLVFNAYGPIDAVRLSQAYFCKQDRLCRFCALRRAARYISKYDDKLKYILSQNPALKVYFVTLTVVNSFELDLVFDHLKGVVKKMNQLRRNYARGNNNSIFGLFESGVMTFELTKSAKGWHPHIHMICLLPRDLRVDEFPWELRPEEGQKEGWADYVQAAKNSQLSKQWKKLTGDSFIVDARPVSFDADNYQGSVNRAFLETFKYALKFSTLDPADNYRAYEVLKGRRLLNSWGDFRGIPEPELVDDLFDEVPYLKMVYRFKRDHFVLESVSPELIDVVVDGEHMTLTTNGEVYSSSKRELDEFLGNTL